jgi:predicted ATPase
MSSVPEVKAGLARRFWMTCRTPLRNQSSFSDRFTARRNAANTSRKTSSESPLAMCAADYLKNVTLVLDDFDVRDVS